MNGVKPERTGWRDAALSERHRRWGFDCPAVDLDFVLIEYDDSRAVAMIEYKNQQAPVQFSSHPTYRAMANFCTDAGRPFFAVRYATDFSWWCVTPLNSKAKEWVRDPRQFSESEYIALLYEIRGREVPPEALEAVEI